MKTLAILTIAACTFATSLFAATNEKFYQVMDNGAFQYTYWMETGKENVKAGIKPVTLRTFFLETEKNGLLPYAMSYSTFEKLTVEEKQALLADAQVATIASMNSREEIVVVIATAPALKISTVEEVQAAEESTKMLPAAKRIDIDSNAPWLIKAVTAPGTENNLPENKVEITIAHTEVIPAVVEMMINEGGQND